MSMKKVIALIALGAAAMLIVCLRLLATNDDTPVELGNSRGMDATGLTLLEEGGDTDRGIPATILSAFPSPIPRWGGQQGSLFAVFSHPGPSFLLFTYGIKDSWHFLPPIGGQV